MEEEVGDISAEDLLASCLESINALCESVPTEFKPRKKLTVDVREEAPSPTGDSAISNGNDETSEHFSSRDTFTSRLRKAETQAKLMLRSNKHRRLYGSTPRSRKAAAGPSVQDKLYKQHTTASVAKQRNASDASANKPEIGSSSPLPPDSSVLKETASTKRRKNIMMAPKRPRNPDSYFARLLQQREQRRKGFDMSFVNGKSLSQPYHKGSSLECGTGYVKMETEKVPALSRTNSWGSTWGLREDDETAVRSNSPMAGESSPVWEVDGEEVESISSDIGREDPMRRYAARYAARQGLGLEKKTEKWVERRNKVRRMPEHEAPREDYKAQAQAALRNRRYWRNRADRTIDRYREIEESSQADNEEMRNTLMSLPKGFRDRICAVSDSARTAATKERFKPKRKEEEEEEGKRREGKATPRPALRSPALRYPSPAPNQPSFSDRSFFDGYSFSNPVVTPVGSPTRNKGAEGGTSKVYEDTEEWVDDKREMKWGESIDSDFNVLDVSSIMPVEQRIVHPQSFQQYVERQQKARAAKLQMQQLREKHSSDVWDNSLTTPKPFKLSCYEKKKPTKSDAADRSDAMSTASFSSKKVKRKKRRGSKKKKRKKKITRSQSVPKFHVTPMSALLDRGDKKTGRKRASTPSRKRSATPRPSRKVWSGRLDEYFHSLPSEPARRAARYSEDETGAAVRARKQVGLPISSPSTPHGPKGRTPRRRRRSSAKKEAAAAATPFFFPPEDSSSSSNEEAETEDETLLLSPDLSPVRVRKNSREEEEEEEEEDIATDGEKGVDDEDGSEEDEVTAPASSAILNAPTELPRPMSIIDLADSDVPPPVSMGDNIVSVRSDWDDEYEGGGSSDAGDSIIISDKEELYTNPPPPAAIKTTPVKAMKKKDAAPTKKISVNLATLLGEGEALLMKKQKGKGGEGTRRQVLDLEDTPTKELGMEEVNMGVKEVNMGMKEVKNWEVKGSPGTTMPEEETLESVSNAIEAAIEAADKALSRAVTPKKSAKAKRIEAESKGIWEGMRPVKRVPKESRRKKHKRKDISHSSSVGSDSSEDIMGEAVEAWEAARRRTRAKKGKEETFRYKIGMTVGIA